MSIFVLSMNYKNFNKFFSKTGDFILPGKKAQFMLSPVSRKIIVNKNNPKKASVLIFCYPKNDKMHVILIKRSDYIGFHSGEISFPGGKFDNQDKNLRHTALREFYEELGVKLISKKNLTKFTPLYIPPSNFIVFPFLTYVNYTPQFYPELNEVAKIIELPISEIFNLKIKYTNLLYGPMKGRKVPCFEFKKYLIWGATAMILNEFKFFLASNSIN